MSSLTTFRVVGTGDTKVLFLPGLFGANEAFDAILAFADTMRFQYVVMDYRGYGCSKRMSGQYTLSEVVADAIRLLDDLGWAETHLIGHSIGALVSQMLAVEAPGRIQSLISLAGMNARGASSDQSRIRMLDEAAHHLDQRIALIHMGVGLFPRTGTLFCA